MPETSYILDAIKEFYINNADPSQIGMDLVDGLKEKENDIAFLTHENIAASLDNYEELEEVVAGTIRDGLSEILNTGKSIEDLDAELPVVVVDIWSTHPDSSSSSSSSSQDDNLYPATDYYLLVTISGGNIPFSSFEYEWDTFLAPEGGMVWLSQIYSEQTEQEWKILSTINFTMSGDYILNFILSHKTVSSMQITQPLTATIS